MAAGAKWAWRVLPVAVLAGAAAVAYRPDRPVPAIVPGSSPGPAFVVQVIRPRLGLPLGGLLSPGLFGLETHLGFDQGSDGAVIGGVEPGRIELAADGWELALVRDGEGRVAPGTRVVFPLVFEERLRRVRCGPAETPVGTLDVAPLADSGGLSGSFDIELAHCEDAETGEPLGWPPAPLVLHGSFDRLPPTADPARGAGVAGVADLDHMATAGDVVGRLVYEAPPAWYVSSAVPDADARPAVTFTGFRPYPSPHSTLQPIVVVNRTTDIGVVIAGRGDGRRWEFAFAGVGPGVYRLSLESLAPAEGWFTMSVQLADSTVGEVPIQGRQLVR